MPAQPPVCNWNFYEAYVTPPSFSANRLTVTYSTYGGIIGLLTKGVGKYYFEASFSIATGSAAKGVGLTPGQNAVNTSNPFRFGVAGCGIQYNSDGSVREDDVFGTTVGYGPTFINGDVIGCAYDANAHKCWFSKNGTFVGNPAAGTGGLALLSTPYNPCAWTITSGDIVGAFSTGSFAHAPPTGFAQWR